MKYKGNYSIFKEKSEQLGRKIIKSADLEKKIFVDLEIPLSCLSIDLANKILRLAPFGIGNHKPIFLSKGTVFEYRLMGKKNNHIRLYLRDSAGNIHEFVYFNGGSDFVQLQKGKSIRVVYRLELNDWGGRIKAQGVIKYLEFLSDS